MKQAVDPMMAADRSRSILEFPRAECRDRIGINNLTSRSVVVDAGSQLSAHNANFFFGIRLKAEMPRQSIQ